MQQMVSLVSVMTPTTTAPAQAQAQGAAQAAPDGAFQALLELLTGTAPAAAPAAAVPTAAMPEQAAPVPAAPVLTVAAPPAPAVQTGAAPVRLNGPVPPALPAAVPQMPVPTALPAVAEVEVAVDAGPMPDPAPDAEISDEPAPAPGPETAPPLAAQAQAAQVVQALMAAQTQTPGTAQLQPLTQDRPEHPAEPAPAAVSADEGANPQLEAFVQKSVRTVQGDKPKAEAQSDGGDPQQPDAKPTFHDLVKLVVDADKATATAPAPEQQPALKVVAPKVAAPKAEEQDAPTINLEARVASRDTAAPTGPDTAPAAPRQPVEPEQVVRQVSRFVKVMVDSKQSEVRLNLHPDNLGSIAVKLVVGEGTLRANLVTQDAAVKAALEANLDQLKTRLADQGLKVEHVQVTVGGGDGAFGQPQHSKQGEQRQPQQQQQWRPQGWTARQQDEPGTAARPRQQTPTLWNTRGTGVRLNSLA